MTTGGVIGRDDDFRISAEFSIELLSDRKLAPNPEFRLQFFDPLRSENTWADYQRARNPIPNHQLAEDQPGADCFTKADIVCE